MVFTDNLGLILAGIFRTQTTNVKSVGGITDITGATFSFRIYGANTDNAFGWILSNNTVKIGKGTSTPTRQDEDIENPFTTAPESGTFANLGHGYNSGLGKITIPATLASTGGTGGISEYVKRQTVRDTGAGTHTIIFLRNTFTPVNFIIGESVNTELEIII